MSMTLNLVDCLLTQARNLHRAGKAQKALDLLERLVRFQVLPSETACEAHALLAELHLKQDDYLKARRHLQAALSHDPNRAEYHLSLAQAIEADPDSRPERARTHYLKALHLEPRNAEYWLEYAVYLVTLGYPVRGLKALRRAYVYGNDNPDLVGRIAETMRQEGHIEEARTKLLASIFRHPGDRRYRSLFQQHQFQAVYDQQQSNHQPKSAEPSEPILLPFTAGPTQGNYTTLGEKTLRFDVPSQEMGPRSRMRRRRPSS